MNRFERQASLENEDKKMAATLALYPKLQETLYLWCDPYSKSVSARSFEEVVSLMAVDVEVRKAVRWYLGEGGAGHARSSEAAETYREPLAWALVELLQAKRKA